MPFKLHSKCRRHIARQCHRVTNWREYDASLRNRGSSAGMQLLGDALMASTSRRRSTFSDSRTFARTGEAAAALCWGERRCAIECGRN